MSAGLSPPPFPAMTNNTLDARNYGIVADGRKDNRAALNKFFADCLTRRCDGLLPPGTIRITGPVDIGVMNPTGDPFPAGSLQIRGAGRSYIEGLGFVSTPGTLILLDATGQDAVLRINRSASRFLRIADFTVASAATDGATYGVVWTDTHFSQHEADNVAACNVTRGFSILTGTGANGEFITFRRCSVTNVARYFYMDSSAGQAFNHLFLHSFGIIRAGGAMFEVGGGNLGYGLTAIECSCSFERITGENHTTFPGATFLINNGVSGPLNFFGGRVEHCSTLVESSGNSGFNAFTDISFTGMSFDAFCPYPPRSRFALKSAGGNSHFTYHFDRCSFQGTPEIGTRWITALDPGSFDRFRFSRCTFKGVDGIGLAVERGHDLTRPRVEIDDCKSLSITLRDQSIDRPFLITGNRHDERWPVAPVIGLDFMTGRALVNGSERDVSSVLTSRGPHVLDEGGLALSASSAAVAIEASPLLAGPAGTLLVEWREDAAPDGEAVIVRLLFDDGDIRLVRAPAAVSFGLRVGRERVLSTQRSAKAGSIYRTAFSWGSRGTALAASASLMSGLLAQASEGVQTGSARGAAIGSDGYRGNPFVGHIRRLAFVGSQMADDAILAWARVV